MSRPPRPYPESPTTGTLTVRDGELDYLPLEHADFVRQQLDLSEAELGSRPPEGSGDFARALFDLSACVAHVLAVYQDHYAAEAFLPSARSATSLTRHAHRLAYTPDGGLSATGHVVLTAKTDVEGTVPAGLKLVSSPLGEARSEKFETTADAPVSGTWNSLLPRDARTPLTLATTATSLTLAGTGHRIRPGALVALVGPGQWSGFQVLAVAEEDGSTTLSLDRARGGTLDLTLTPWSEDTTTHGHRLLVEPSRQLRIFGWDADPGLYPPDKIHSAGAEPAGGLTGLSATPKYAYRVAEDSDTTNDYSDQHLYLSTAEDDPIGDGWLLRWDAAPQVFRVRTGDEAAATVSLVRAWQEEVVTGVDLSGTTVTTTTGTVDQERLLSKTVTRLTLRAHTSLAVNRTVHSLGATFHGGWRRQIPLVTDTPSTDTITEGSPLAVRGDLTGMSPGHLLALQTLDEGVSQIVMLTEITLPEEGDDPAVSTITWRAVTEAPAGHTWTLGDLQIRGNVAPISHGTTLEEVLGGSDGVSPFQTFALKRSPLTRLSTGSEIAPVLTVRVDGVAWQRVDTFHDSAPDSRHFLLTLDAAQAATVMFGDGTRGAIPPAGRRNLTATYRIGIGTAGNVSAGRISRIARSSPLLEGALNVVETDGGAEPASAEGIRTQATRYIRTFDRAVSVSDHADLAMLWPGVGAAAARWDATAGIILVIAAEDGTALADAPDFRAWLDARRDTSLRLTIAPPVAVQVHLGLYVEYDPAWLMHAVDADIHDALWGDAGLFTFPMRDLGQAAHLSEVYALLNAIEGVTYVEITHLALTDITDAGNPTVHDSLQVGPDQWLSMSDAHLTTTPPTDRTT